eukprot:7254500-Ditylum_brightwellii.AAC.1
MSNTKYHQHPFHYHHLHTCKIQFITLIFFLLATTTTTSASRTFFFSINNHNHNNVYHHPTTTTTTKKISHHPPHPPPLCFTFPDAKTTSTLLTQTSSILATYTCLVTYFDRPR